MANQERNGRNVAMPDENRPSWRPTDEDRSQRMTDRDDRSIERYGQGQSGYGAGRYEGDRSYGSRNQANMSAYDRDRGTDERFVGGRGGEPWSPMDRGDRGMQGSNYQQHGQYGHTGHWTEQDGGYLGQGGQRLGYGGDQQSQRMGGHGSQNQGGMYGQGGYNEGMYGQGGQQNRFGSQGYQGYPQNQEHHHRYSGRMIGEPRYGHPGQHGYGQGFGQSYFSEQGTSGSGYGHQPEHESHFGSGQTYGTHRGKGPSGYTRSDDRIREMICDVLTDHDDIDASNIEVNVKNGEVTLAGHVEARRIKRLVEDSIEHLSGVKDVVNNLRVSDRKIAGTSSGKDGGPAVEKSGAEQSLQNQGNDKRHRA